jgi:hypothetical protein
MLQVIQKQNPNRFNKADLIVHLQNTPDVTGFQAQID